MASPLHAKFTENLCGLVCSNIYPKYYIVVTYYSWTFKILFPNKRLKFNSEKIKNENHEDLQNILLKVFVEMYRIQ